MRRRTSGLVLAAMVASTLPTMTATAAAQEPPAPEVVISQVYGGGGNTGAPAAFYRNDFLELFNRGDAPQDITGWSIQYTSANGNTWGSNSTTLPSATLQPGQRYLVQMAAGSNAEAAALPTPDHTSSINMSATSGKVALASSSAALPTDTCPTGPTVVDAVGFGTQNCEAIQATTALNNNSSALRDEDRCAETFSIVSPPEPENSSAPLAPCGAEPSGPRLVISQVYGGGGQVEGSPYRNDFVELFNAGGTAADVSGMSLQYGSATGNFGSSAALVTELSGSIEPGGYLLVGLASGGANGEPLPTPDVTGSTNASATSGKFALAEGTTALGCGATTATPNPCTAEDLERIVDLVGFGTSGTFEGSGPAPAPSNTTAIFRADDGCQDTDDNAADFSTGAPAPRNSSSPINLCTPPTDAPIVTECPSSVTVTRGSTTDAQVSATDEDDAVTDAAITSDPVEGITLDDVTPAAAPGGTLTGTLNVDATDLDLGTYPVDITFTNDQAPEAQTATCTVDVEVVFTGDVCEVDDEDLTLIHEIQGDGATTPIPGQRLITRGVITADFSSGGDTGLAQGQGLRGFFIEAIADDRDNDPDTSEGLFVFDPDTILDGEVGDLVYVYGVAGEGPASAGRSVTQVTADDIGVCNDNVDATDLVLPDPAALPMPVHPSDRGVVLGPLESMRVTHPELTVTDFWQLERFGEVFLSSGGVRPNPTNLVSPHDDEAYLALERENAANTILLDDGRSGQNLDPLPYVVPGDTLRIGDQLIDETFILHYGFSAWRLQPLDIDELTEEFRTNRTRPRPEDPPNVGGTLTVGAFNVLNYFNGDGYFIGDDPDTAEGFPTSRGARSVAEFERQTEKIVDAILRMDADILGLIEIENDEGEDQAAAALVDAVNTTAGEDLYDYLDTGTIGTDAIKLAYIYKPSTVELAGDYAILDSSVDERFNDQRSRPVLAQTFTELATGESVTVANNHLKSKGSGCGPGDDHPRQGSCNLTRTLAAEAMADWLAEDPTGQDAVGNLIVGDLNSYAQEDPIVALQEAGYIDLLDVFAPEGVMPYTYTFSGTQGYLDYALADEELFPTVTGAAAWNINADEVPAIDYLLSGNGRFRTADVAERFYDDSAFRSSDHDPVLVGLDLAGEGENWPPTVEDLELTTDQDTPVSGQLVIDDPDGDPLTVTYGTPSSGTVTGDDTGAFTYSPASGFVGTATFQVTVSDERGGTDTATVTIRVREADGGDPDEEYLECPPGVGSGFRDVPPTSVHADNVRCAADLGLMLGRRDGNFEPGWSVIRGQAASVIDRIAEATGRPVPGPGRSFPDVPDGYVHADAIERLANAGVIAGFPDGTFRPNNPVTRGQLARLLVNYIESATGEELELGEPFPDVPANSDLGIVLRKARAAGIFNGTDSGEAQPQRPIRRDQAASLFVRSLDQLPLAD
jgi:uncharacterized protein